VLTLARFSEAFLILRAQSAWLYLELAPFVLVGMNVVYSLSAYPPGVLSDTFDRRSIVAIGFSVLIVHDNMGLVPAHEARSNLADIFANDYRLRVSSSA
jgi:hypothetical protein